jgi:hypothetical protein
MNGVFRGELTQGCHQESLYSALQKAEDKGEHSPQPRLNPTAYCDADRQIMISTTFSNKPPCAHFGNSFIEMKAIKRVKLRVLRIARRRLFECLSSSIKPKNPCYDELPTH